MARDVNAGVVVKPDDTVVIRISLRDGPGYPHRPRPLAAVELECDWSKVATDYPTPGQNPARNRAWQSFSTGGSRGSRQSNQYARHGGAAAREMLIQAAPMNGRHRPLNAEPSRASSPALRAAAPPPRKSLPRLETAAGEATAQWSS
jgi:isoquinoline 1-oxidoreductase beta subunit